jgi:hypothetical protein
MRKFVIILFCLFSIRANCQIISFAGKQNGYISNEDLLKDNAKFLTSSEGTVLGFKLIIYFDPLRDIIARRNLLSEEALKRIRNASAGSGICFKEVKVMMPDSSIRFLSSSIFAKDGLHASLLQIGDGKFSNYFANALKKPKIYAYPDFRSSDTTLYKVVSFSINSSQPDKYYELNSESDVFSSEIIEFLKKARYDFQLSNIKAVDQKGHYTELPIITLKHDSSDTNGNFLLRTKNQLLSMQKIDFIASVNVQRIFDSKLYSNKDIIHTGFYIKGINDELSLKMKNYIKDTAKIGDVLAFDIEYYNKEGGQDLLQIDVKIVE